MTKCYDRCVHELFKPKSENANCDVLYLHVTYIRTSVHVCECVRAVTDIFSPLSIKKIKTRLERPTQAILFFFVAIEMCAIWNVEQYI